MTLDTPLRLKTLAEIASSEGWLTASSLNLEAQRGRLECFYIAGKKFSTMRAVTEMVEQCRSGT